MSFDAAKAAADEVIAQTLESAGNLVSGLDLTPIGEDGHALANKLWKISGYLRGRAS